MDPTRTPRPRRGLRAATIVAPLALLTLLVFSVPAAASGYHPPFDRAVQQAEWILLSSVVSEHAPGDALTGLPKNMNRGRVYRVRVKRAFKGSFSKGQELLIWDPWRGSTAGYFLSVKAPNLTFLTIIGPNAPQSPTGKGRRGFTPPRFRTVTPKKKGERLAVPIRNLGGPKPRAAGVDAWVRLLELTKVGKQKLSLAQARGILKRSKDWHLLIYALTHWPGKLSDADTKLVRKVMKANIKAGGVTWAGAKLLRAHGKELTVAELRFQLEKAKPNVRRSLLRSVTAANAAKVQDLIWQWIQRDQDGAQDAIEVLGRLAPKFLEGRLAKVKLPFWLDIPALKALNKTPRDFGRKAYPPRAMETTRWVLDQNGAPGQRADLRRDHGDAADEDGLAPRAAARRSAVAAHDREGSRGGHRDAPHLRLRDDTQGNGGQPRQARPPAADGESRADPGEVAQGEGGAVRGPAGNALPDPAVEPRRQDEGRRPGDLGLPELRARQAREELLQTLPGRGAAEPRVRSLAAPRGAAAGLQELHHQAWRLARPLRQ